MTVLLISVAATIAVAASQASSLNARTTGTRMDQTAAWRDADSALAALESLLAGSPDQFLRQVLPAERARVCHVEPYADDVFQPGASWPSVCGSVWSYTDPSTSGDTAMEITPPSASDARLSVRILVHKGASDAGYDASYVMDGAGRWVWSSTDRGTVASPAPSSSVSLQGGMYANGSIDGPPTGVTLAAGSAAVAADGSLGWTPTGSGVGYYSRTPNPTSSPRIGNVRDVAAVPMAPGQLSAAIVHYGRVACPGLDETGAVSPAHNLTVGDATRLAHMCLVPGAVLTDVNNVPRTVPSTTRSVMLVFEDSNLAAVGVGERIAVYTSDARPDLSDNSPLACGSSSTCSLYEVQYDLGQQRDPGRREFWKDPTIGSRYLGTFNVPASGVVQAAADVYFGYCSTQVPLSGDTHEWLAGANCVPNSTNPTAADPGPTSMRDPGLTVSSRLTVVAGTFAEPRDLVVNAPINATDTASVALVGTARVLLPYWTHAPDALFRVDAHLFGAGAGRLFAGESVSSFPSSDRYPSAAASPDAWSTELGVRGSITGRQLRTGLAGFDKVTWRYSPGDASGAAPWFGGSDVAWSRISAHRIVAADVSESCAEALACPSWGDTNVVVVSPADGTPEAPSGIVPDPPTNVIAAISDIDLRIVRVRFTAAPLPAGATPVEYFTVVTAPGGQTCQVTTVPLECYIGDLTSGPVNFTVTATNAAGTSAPSDASNDIAFVPNSPSGVDFEQTRTGSADNSATVSWDEYSNADRHRLTITPAGEEAPVFYFNDNLLGSTVTIPGLSSGEYTVKLEACSGSGEVCSEPFYGSGVITDVDAHLITGFPAPLVWWRLDGSNGTAGHLDTVADWTGWESPGTVAGTPVGTADAVIGVSAGLPGYTNGDVMDWSVSYLNSSSVTSPAGVMPTRGATMAGWFNIAGGTGHGRLLTLKGSNNATVSVGIGAGSNMTSNGNRLVIETAGSCSATDTGFSIPAGWHHLLVTTDPSSGALDVYVDTNLAYSSATCIPAAAVTTAAAMVGGAPGTTSPDGVYAANVMFWDTQLTPKQLVAVYNQAATTFMQDPVAAIPRLVNSRAYPSGYTEVTVSAPTGPVLVYEGTKFLGALNQTDLAESRVTWATNRACSGTVALIFRSWADIGLNSNVTMTPCSGNEGTTTVASGAYTSTVAADSPWAWWRFQDGAGTTYYDQSGNGRALTQVSGAAPSRPIGAVVNQSSASRKAIGFNAATPTRLTGPVMSTALFDFDQPFSYEGWVNYNPSTVSSYQTLMTTFGPSPEVRGIDFSVVPRGSHGHVALRLISDLAATPAPNAAGAVALTSLPAGRWTHVVATYDGSGRYEGIQLYIDGVQVKTAPVAGTLINGTVARSPGGDVLHFGEREETGSPTNSVLDEFAIYTDVLSPERVLDHFASSGLTPRAPHEQALIANGVTLAYQFDGAATSIAPSFAGPQTGNATITGGTFRQTPAGNDPRFRSMTLAGSHTGLVEIPVTKDTFPTYGVTAGGWVKSTGASGWEHLYGRGPSNPNETYAIYRNATSSYAQALVRVDIAGTPTRKTCNSTAGTVPANSWSFIAMTYTEGVIRLYVNDEVFVCDVAGGGAIVDTAGKVRIGNADKASALAYRLSAADFDNVFFADYPMTYAQISEMKAGTDAAPLNIGAPPAPTGLAVSATTYSATTLSWNNAGAYTSQVDSYEAAYSIDGGDSWYSVITPAHNDSVRFEDLPSGPVALRVRAVNSNGESAWVTTSETIPVMVIQPNPPTNLGSSAIKSTSFTLSWTAPVPNGVTVTGYTIQMSTNGGSTWTNKTTATAAATSKSVTGLAQNTNYQFRVIANSANDPSVPSATLAVTTLQAPTVPNITSFTVTPTKGFYDVVWTQPAGGPTITSYTLAASRCSGTSWVNAPAPLGNNPIVVIAPATSGRVTGTTWAAGPVARIDITVHASNGETSTTYAITGNCGNAI